LIILTIKLIQNTAMIFVKSTPIKVMFYYINCPFPSIKKGQHFKQYSDCQLGCRQFSTNCHMKRI